MKLDKIKVPLPPLPLQKQFSELVEKVEKLKNQYDESRKELEQLYGSLSQKAFKEEVLSFNKAEDNEYTKGLDKLNKGIANFHHSLPHSGANDEIDNKLRQLDTELKIRGEVPYWSEYVKYRLMDKKFTYQELKDVVTKFPFHTPPSVEEVQKVIIESLESNPPFIEQVFDYHPLQPKTKEEGERIHKIIHFIKTDAAKTV